MSLGQPFDAEFWAGWQEPLAQFAAGARVMVSLYDVDGLRQVGPYSGTSLGEMLLQSAQFHQGVGLALEQQLARRAMESGERTSAHFEQSLSVYSQPLSIDQRVCGALVFGWGFDHFPSSLECARLAHALELDATELWRCARREPPISVQRIAISGDLLTTLATAHGSQLVAVARAYDLARIRDLFFARAAHELRNPLWAISLRVTTLLESTLENPNLIRAGLEKIAKAAATEAKLVEDLVDAGRTLTGELRVDMAPLHLGELVRETVETFGPIAESKRVQLSAIEDPDAVRARISGDGVRLRQIIGNLLANAIKFTPEGGAVTVKLQTGSSVELEVTDTGIGIDPAVADKIFDPFVRTDHGNESGLGLGLAITRQIVDLHGGHIQAASAGPGCGTTFKITLPVLSAREA